MPTSRRRIYLDHNATAPLRPSAARASAEAPWGNPSGVHQEGRAARRALEDARSALGHALGLDPRGFVFTASATEANALALRAAGDGLRVLTALEHASIRVPATRRGAQHHILPASQEGRASPSDLPDHAALLSVIAAESETGALHDLLAFATAAHSRDMLLHVDASQAVGRIPVPPEAWGADLLTLSSHKLGGPRGAGTLWIRPGVAAPPPLLEGGRQERGRRAGTEDVAAIAGFAAALAQAVETQPTEADRLAALRETLWQGLADRVPRIRRITPSAALPQTLAVAFEGADGEALLFGLDLEGLAASMGSACSSGSVEASPVLLALGLGEELARSTLRLSLGWTTTAEDIERALEILPRVVERSRGGSST